MSDSNQPPILIVGAGLAGLSLAAILQKNNIPYFVFESSPRMRTQGHGLTLHPWAYLPLSQALDIDPGQLGSAVATDSAIGGRGVIDPQVHDVYSGRVMESGSETLASDTFNHAQSFRARKSAIGEFLLKRIDPSKMFWEWKLKTCDIRDGCVIAGFDNGESMTGRLLVAADGLHSAARCHLIPETKHTITALTVYNGRRTVSRALFDDRFGPYMRNTTALSGKGYGFAFEININYIDGSKAAISWTYSHDGDSSVDPSFQLSQPHPGIARTIIAELAQLRDLTAPFHYLPRKEDLECDTLYNWVMRSVRIPLTSLSNLALKRIVLIGDAAHAMPIYRGTGGNQALVDSTELGNLLCGLAERGEFPRSTELTDTQLAVIFYEKAYTRWQDAIVATESQLLTMHQPIEALRASRVETLDSKI